MRIPEGVLGAAEEHQTAPVLTELSEEGSAQQLRKEAWRPHHHATTGHPSRSEVRVLSEKHTHWSSIRGHGDKENSRTRL